MSTVNRKKIVQRIIAGVLLVCVISAGLFFTTKKTEAGWYDDNWAYRKAINITGHTAAENNVFLNLTGGSALDSQGASKTNCGDIRFTDANGKVLPYFIVSGCKTASTVIHVFFETFPAGAQTIYYYYGNPSARDGFSLTDFSTAATGVTFGSYGSQEVGPGPVAYWKFDEGYGTTINSNTQTGPSMTLAVGSGTPWTTEERCVSGKCLFFNATGNVTANTSISDIRTVQFWVKPKTTTGFLFSVDGTDSLGQVTASSGTITASGTLNGSTFYINGTYTATPTLVANVWQHITVVTPSNTTMSAFFMGEMGGAPTFTGFVDEVKLYRSVRSATEIKSDVVRWATAEGSSAVLSSPNSNISGPLSSGLIGYWNLDESASPALDKSGQGMSGTWTNTPTAVGGKFGSSINLNGSNQYISMGDQSIHDISLPFTVSAWINMDQLPSTKGTDDEIVSKYSTAPNRQWTFAIGTDNGLYFWKSHNGTNGEYLVTNGYTFTSADVGVWRHVSFTADEKGNCKIYVDGVIVDTYTMTNTTFYSGASTNLLIGARNNPANYFDGKIDDVRIYNRALTPAEQKELYQWAPGPVGHWKMDESIGQTVIDTSGNNNSLTLGASTATGTDDPSWVTGKFGKALQFDGNNDYAFVGDSGTSALDMSGNMTITTWFYKNQDTDTNSWADLVTKSDTSAFDTNYWFQIHDVSDVEFLDFYFSNDNGSYEVRGTQPIQLNTWHHAAVVYNDAANTIQFYLDGVPQSGSNVEVFGTNGHLESLRTNNEDLRVGSTYANQQFPGAIDDVKIYNYARTSTQIVEDLNAGHPAPGSPVGSAYGYWKMNEGYGSTVYDSGTGGTNGTASNTTWTLGGKYDKALQFNGSNSGVSFGTTDFFGGKSEGSICTWLRFGYPTVGGDGVILSNYNNSIIGWLMWVDDDAANSGRTNTISFAADPNVAGGRVEGSTNLVTPGVWDHYCAVFKGSEYIKLYKNGRLDQQQTSSVPAVFSTGSSYTTYIGRSMDGRYFAGDIDEMKILYSALSDEQVRLEYNAGKALQLGSVSTDSDGKTATSSAERIYCIPGDTATCNPPILHFKMDENTGEITYDGSGNNYTGSLNGSAVWTRGKQGAGLELNGTDNRVDVTGFSYPTTDYTYEIWIKPRNFSTSNAIFSGPTASVGGNEFMVDTDTDLDIDVISNGALVVNGTNGRITQNKWNHVAIVRSGTSITTYINGVVDITGTDGVSYSFASCPLTIGAQRASTTCSSISANTWFNGMLDDIRVYTYARTAGQIAWDYNNGAPTHIYKFNECQGTTVYNSAQTSDGRATGLNGALTLAGNSAGTCESVTSTDTWYMGENGKYGAALALDGNDYAVVATPGLPTVDFTYAAWIYLDTINNDRPILKAADGAGANELKLEIMANDGANPQKLRFAADGTSIYSSRAIETGRWYHIVGRRTNGTMEMFINGQKDSVTGSDSTTLNFSTCGLYIGAGPTSACDGGISTYFDGMIDDLRIYAYSLTEAQIQTVMNEGSAVRFGP